MRFSPGVISGGEAMSLWVFKNCATFPLMSSSAALLYSTSVTSLILPIYSLKLLSQTQSCRAREATFPSKLGPCLNWINQIQQRDLGSVTERMHCSTGCSRAVKGTRSISSAQQRLQISCSNSEEPQL